MSIPPGGFFDIPAFDPPTACFQPNCNFVITVDVNNDVDESDPGEKNNTSTGVCTGLGEPDIVTIISAKWGHTIINRERDPSFVSGPLAVRAETSKIGAVLSLEVLECDIVGDMSLESDGSYSFNRGASSLDPGCVEKLDSGTATVMVTSNFGGKAERGITRAGPFPAGE
jgi:hypothetical protein